MFKMGTTGCTVYKFRQFSYPIMQHRGKSFYHCLSYVPFSTLKLRLNNYIFTNPNSNTYPYPNYYPNCVVLNDILLELDTRSKIQFLHLRVWLYTEKHYFHQVYIFVQNITFFLLQKIAIQLKINYLNIYDYIQIVCFIFTNKKS